jgi:chemotaxis signal transduction protein
MYNKVQDMIDTTDTSITLSETTTDSTLLIITCTIGTQQYGFPIDAVREVVRLPALLTLAGAPPVICGLLNLRARYLPVLSGRILVAEPPTYDINNQIIIAGYKEPEFGLLVDQVHDVTILSREQWTPINQHTAAAFFKGVFTAAHTSVILFDVAALKTMVPNNT